MANVSRDFKTGVSTFNKQMIRIQNAGKTTAASFKEFDYFSGIHDYRNLYRTDKNGNLVLRTDYKKMTDAEAEAMEDLIDKVVEAGPTTLTGIKQEYLDFVEEYGDDLTEEAYEHLKDEIAEESLHRVYYDAKNHTTTAAVDNKMTKAEALNMLVDLAAKGKTNPYTGKIYVQSIKARLKKYYG